MARLEVRPATCQTTNSGWSQTLSLSTPPHIVDPATAPAWIITLSLVGTAAAERGPELLESISHTFETVELKTPEALYQTLNQLLAQELHASVAAICLTSSTSTVMGKGNFKIQLWRNNQVGSILSGTDSDAWQVVEGSLHQDDRWWLSAGDSKSIPPIQVLQADDIEQAVSDLRTSLMSLSDCNLANSILFSSLSASNDIQLPTELPELVSPTPISPKIAKKRRVMVIGWLLLIALAVSVWFGSRARTEQQLANAYTKLEQQANTAISTATTLAQSDQVQARQQLRDLQLVVSQAKTTFEKNNKWLATWQSLDQKVTQSYQQLAGETALNDLPIWFSLSVIKSEFKGDKITVAGDNLIILDKVTNTMAKINIPAKRGESIVTNLQLKNSTALAADTNRALTITNEGIITSTIGKTKSASVLIPTDTEWQQPTFLGIFNGNIYMLDEGAGLIWRYAATATGVAEKKNWLGSGVSFSGPIKNLSVDGDIWLLKDGGTISRYRRGAPLSFTLSGLDKPLSASVTALAVASVDKIALIDAGNQRIIVCTKQGSYLKQIAWTGLSTAQDISFSSDGNSLFILKDGAIYTAAL